MDALRAHFSPEFLNRVDDVIMFHPLGREHLAEIIDIQLRALARRLAERKIVVELTEAAKAMLVAEGYDPAYGARPLKRTLQRRLLDPLALEMLQGRFVEGDHVVADAANGELRFTKG
jgi:ATP-dependent Clp protease ATP-binding subunit ClpB